MHEHPAPCHREILHHAAWVRRLAANLARDSHEAEDLAQQTWLIALQGSPDTERAVRDWLGCVLRHLSARASGSRFRRSAREEGAARPER